MKTSHTRKFFAFVARSGSVVIAVTADEMTREMERSLTSDDSFGDDLLPRRDVKSSHDDWESCLVSTSTFSSIEFKRLFQLLEAFQ